MIYKGYKVSRGLGPAGGGKRGACLMILKGDILHAAIIRYPKNNLRWARGNLTKADKQVAQEIIDDVL